MPRPEHPQETVRCAILVVVLLASVLVGVALVAVIVVIHLEQRGTVQSTGAPPRPAGFTVWAARHAQAQTIDDLAELPFPRARMGYDPVAVRAVLVEMANAYAELAASAEPETVAHAWAQARGHAVAAVTEGTDDEAGPHETQDTGGTETRADDVHADGQARSRADGGRVRDGD